MLTAKPAPSRSSWLRLVLAAIGVLVVVVLVRHRIQDPAISLLVSEEGASWIRYPDPFLYMGRPAGQETTVFRRRFTVDKVPDEARLIVRGFKVPIVVLDAKPLGQTGTKPERWKEALELELAPALQPGSHELIIAVQNGNGHALALARCPELGWKTDGSWEASHDGRTWLSAVPVEAPESLPLWQRFPNASEALARQASWLVALFISTCVWTLARGRGHLSAFACTPSRLRWLLIAAWIVLAANNFLKIPLAQGFDHDGHLEYVHFIAERGRLPLARDGWEMYQAPLYYILTALLQKGLALLGRVPVEPCLRLLPLACGALQVEIAHRMLRHAFKDRDDVQCAGIWIAGLMPMNLYVSQVVGNEPLGGITSAVVFLLCVRALCRSSDVTPLREAAWIGLALGIALLSKMSAVLWIPLAGAALVGGAFVQGQRLRTGLARAGVAWIIAASVAGWYYARNWIELGKAFVGNWDWKECNRIWWQDPGYRIPQHFTRFGHSIVQPVYATVHGFWDSMYSTMWTDGMLGGALAPPPWNQDCMLAGAWLGLPITAAILAAMLGVQSPSGSARRMRQFAALAVLVFFAAALYVYLVLPIYSAAKATYTLGLIPGYGLLAAAGLRPLLQLRWPRAVVNGFLVCFGAASYAAYFVL